MGNDIQRLVDLKKKIDSARTRADRAAGALEGLLASLKKDWGCSTIEEAREKLKVMTEKTEKLRVEFGKKVEKFEEVWGDQLGKLS